MSSPKEKILDEFCGNCGGRLKQFPVSDGTTEKGCPNFYRNEDCKEVIEE